MSTLKALTVNELRISRHYGDKIRRLLVCERVKAELAAPAGASISRGGGGGVAVPFARGGGSRICV